MPSSSTRGSRKPAFLSKSKHKSDDWSQILDPEERERTRNRVAKRKSRTKARDKENRNLHNLNLNGSYQGRGANGLDLTESGMDPSPVLPSFIQSSPGCSEARPGESFTIQDGNYMQGQAATYVPVPYVDNPAAITQAESHASVPCLRSISHVKQQGPQAHTTPPVHEQLTYQARSGAREALGIKADPDYSPENYHNFNLFNHRQDMVPGLQVLSILGQHQPHLSAMTTSGMGPQGEMLCPCAQSTLTQLQTTEKNRETQVSEIGSQGFLGMPPNAPEQPQGPVAGSPAAKLISQKNCDEKIPYYCNKTHMPGHVIHTGDRTYECAQCVNIFSQRDSLERNLQDSPWTEFLIGYGSMDTTQNYDQEGPYSMVRSGAHSWQRQEVGLVPMGIDIETGSIAAPLCQSNTWPIIRSTNWNLKALQEPSDLLSTLAPAPYTNTATVVFRKEGDEDDITSFLKYELSPSVNVCLEMKDMFPEYSWQHDFDVSQHVTGLTVWYYIPDSTISVSFKLCAQKVSRSGIFDHNSAIKGSEIISAPAPVEHSRVAAYLSSLKGHAVTNLDRFVTQFRAVITPVSAGNQEGSLANLFISFELNPNVSENDLLHDDSEGIELLNEQRNRDEYDCEFLLDQPSQHVVGQEADAPEHFRQGTPHQPANSDTSIPGTFKIGNQPDDRKRVRETTASTEEKECFQWQSNIKKANEFWMVV
ncbi:uncharacterized protein PpBr36_10426 [Pyricularia pennisetigena]|uniref:uncharacterized protein n=1 Tax=Pyricularia pennisetigena TaxID=1578925 RepID=UPI001153808D|nr:uncharacterized protein PpBr36_10426 [Pyricularia pennisetigena]TLS21437.1 hypothetical protein PpBr36_10426 [Pyricularia pennisetigena]